MYCLKGESMMQMNSSQLKTAVLFQSIQQIQTVVREALQFVMGDSSPEILGEMSTIFMEDAIPLINQMKLSYDSHDFKSISMAAHALKGSSATMGLIKIADLCLAIEISSKLQEYDQLGIHISDLESEYAQIRNALLTFQI
jgi:HPt (histidine-containing phosphotransfer) domain-containing protein